MDEITFRENASIMLSNFKQLSESICLIYEDIVNEINKHEKIKIKGRDYYKECYYNTFWERGSGVTSSFVMKFILRWHP